MLCLHHIPSGGGVGSGGGGGGVGSGGGGGAVVIVVTITAVVTCGVDGVDGNVSNGPVVVRVVDIDCGGDGDVDGVGDATAVGKVETVVVIVVVGKGVVGCTMTDKKRITN